MGYWIVDGESRYDDIDDLCDYLFDTDNYYDDDGLDDWINEMYPSVNIAGVTFYPADIVSNCDDYLYSELRHDYAEQCAENDRDEYGDMLESMCDGEEQWVNSWHVKYIEDEPDEEIDDDDFYKDDEEEVDEEEEIIIKTLMDHFQHIS